MTALVAGGAGAFTHGASDLRTGSRANFRRGLAASAALHLLLLAILLHATGGGDAVVRTYVTPTDVTLERFRTIPPPTISPPTTAFTQRTQPDWGIIAPRDMPLDLPVDPFREVPPARPIVPGGGSGSPPEGNIPTVSAAPTGLPDAVFEVVDEPPVPIFAPPPAYPPWAREAGVTGQVLLNVLVGKDGRVRRVVIVRDVADLGEAAREALARWVFRPARMNRAAVSTWVAIPVRFEL